MKMQQILEVDFKFSNRKAAMEDARTNSWIVKSVGSSVSLFPIGLYGLTYFFSSFTLGSPRGSVRQ